MILLELLRLKKQNEIITLYYEDMEIIGAIKTNPFEVNNLLVFPIKILSRKNVNNKIYTEAKILITKAAIRHAKQVRKISNCSQCCRYSWCEDLSDELKEEVRRMKNE